MAKWDLRSLYPCPDASCSILLVDESAGTSEKTGPHPEFYLEQHAILGNKPHGLVSVCLSTKLGVIPESLVSASSIQMGVGTRQL